MYLDDQLHKYMTRYGSATSLRVSGWPFLLPLGGVLYWTQASALYDGPLGGCWPVFMEGYGMQMSDRRNMGLVRERGLMG